MKYAKWFVAGALALPMIATTALADEKNEQTHPQQKVTMDELPAAVKATVQRESQGKTVESMAKEQQNGKTVYEIEVVSNGKEQEIKISEAGKVLKRSAAHDGKTEPEHEAK